jgi:hypothetical protein
MTLLTSGGYAAEPTCPKRSARSRQDMGPSCMASPLWLTGSSACNTTDAIHSQTRMHPPRLWMRWSAQNRNRHYEIRWLEGRCIHNKLGAPAALYGGGDAPGALRHAAFAAADSACRPHRPLADHAVDGADLDEREGRTAEGRIPSLQGGRVGLSKGANGAEVPPAWLLSS